MPLKVTVPPMDVYTNALVPDDVDELDELVDELHPPRAIVVKAAATSTHTLMEMREVPNIANLLLRYLLAEKRHMANRARAIRGNEASPSSLWLLDNLNFFNDDICVHDIDIDIVIGGIFIRNGKNIRIFD
ncbi:MAG: hypothetical protein P4L33_16670 [Capsulimonadaceae bacterium]|nr:hypothetical protein [Capsulimonadaceae bacterium]